MDAALRWYVVHTRAHAEQDALRNLVRQGFDAFLPQYEKRRRHARRVDWVPAPLFPRYLFVAMDVALHRWRAIASTIGVTHLVSVGDRPAVIPPGVVENLQARVNENGLIEAEPKVPFKKGEPVQVLSGAFADQTGFFDCATDEERVILLLKLLGRDVRVKLPMAAVVPVG
jgi:transcriptional antiterminator RfaH